MKKRILSMVLVIIMTLAVVITTGCGSDENADIVNIGVVQYMQHKSLDEAYEGFVDGLAEAGYVEGENLKIDFHNAKGEAAKCQQICEIFDTNDSDLVLAIATPAAQAAVDAFDGTATPVLFTAVTDAVGTGLVDSNEAPGKNVTGTIDMPVIESQISLIKDILPEAGTLAILYTDGETNSKIQAEKAKAAAEALGMTVVIKTASSSKDIPQVISSAAAEADAIYIPSDNVFAGSMKTVNSTAVENQIPVFCGVEAMIDEGGIATAAIDYYELGKQTAAQAVRVLEGEAASEIPVETQKEMALVVNEEFAKSVGVDIPEEVVKLSEK